MKTSPSRSNTSYPQTPAKHLARKSLTGRVTNNRVNRVGFPPLEALSVASGLLRATGRHRALGIASEEVCH